MIEPVDPTTDILTGVLVIDKPAGITSHDVVSRIRKRFGTERVGHLGTLDPMATGVLPLTIGRATRLARFIPGTPKEYTGRIRLGQNTTTCDAEGDPEGEARPVDLAVPDLDRAMDSLRGELDQTPPAYSAKKVGGVRAYRMARRGEHVDLEPVRIAVEAFEAVRWHCPDLDFRVICSPGTYVRSLARDLGSRLGTGAHLVELRRTRSGPFSIEAAVSPDRAGPGDLIAPGDAVSQLPRLEVDAAAENDIRHGRPIACPEPRCAEGSFLAIFNKNSRLIAVATRNGVSANPTVVLL